MTALSLNVAERVAQVDALLDSVRGELVAADSPHRRALALLGSHPNGAPVRVHDEGAFAIWRELLRIDPEDVESRHHLAIMAHARAIEREQGDTPKSSNADWEEALGHWAALWESAVFWDRIASVVSPVEPGADAKRLRAARAPIDALRERFPALVLRLHLDVALDPATPHHRARHHVGLLLRAPFPEESKHQVRRAAYETLAAAIPDAVWLPHMLDGDVIDAGMAVIQRYLNVDPEGESALIDALRLQVRKICVDSNQLAAIGSDDAAGRTALLQRLQRTGDAWNPYFETLRSRAPSLPATARRDLCTWYRVGGDVLCELNRHAEALAPYESGAAVGQDDDEEQERCRFEVVNMRALLARRAALARDPHARATTDTLAARPDLTVEACQQLGNAYLLLREFDLADAMCNKGRELHTAPASYPLVQRETLARAGVVELSDIVARARTQRQAELQALGAQALSLRDEARDRTAVQDYAGARAILERAKVCCTPAGLGALKTEVADVLTSWAVEEANAVQQGDRSLDDRVAAYRASFGHLQEALRSAPDYERAAENLATLRGMFTTALRSLAATVYETKRYADAEKVLREALATCRSEDRRNVASDLSIVLANRAVSDVNAKEGTSKISAVTASYARLLEAIQLDPKNQHALDNLKLLREVAVQLGIQLP